MLPFTMKATPPIIFLAVTSRPAGRHLAHPFRGLLA
jgi:hypothetical protein